MRTKLTQLIETHYSAFLTENGFSETSDSESAKIGVPFAVYESKTLRVRFVLDREYLAVSIAPIGESSWFPAGYAVAYLALLDRDVSDVSELAQRVSQRYTELVQLFAPGQGGQRKKMSEWAEALSNRQLDEQLAKEMAKPWWRRWRTK